MRGRREQIHFASGQSFRLLRWGDNLRDVDSLLAGKRIERIVGEGMHWHYHSGMELTHFLTGEGIRFIGDHIAPFSAGEVVLLGENLPHHWHTRGPSTGVSLQWSFPPQHPFWSFPETVGFERLFRSAERGIRYTGTAALEIQQLMASMVQADAPGRLGFLLRILSLLASAPERDYKYLSARSFTLQARPQHAQAVEGVMRYLLANYRGPIRLSEVLRLAQMSKPTFARQFRKHSGKSFSEFLTHLRLRSACRELEETNHPVLDIALECGFSHVSFFNRVFRRILKTSPTRYRASRRPSLSQITDGNGRGSLLSSTSNRT
jgi:AraC-like DNA-binding protein/mannose-6-phosphate isomerase-like protein (cupin superfamily)